MRLKRVPQDSVFYQRMSDLVGQMRQCNLVLAELSGIEVSERREVASRLHEISGSADDDMGAVLRALRENYITPFDRGDLYLLGHHMRDICHRLHGVGFVLASEAFDELPSGVLETLAVLSNQTDHTSRMITRLPGRLDQWDYVDAINRLTYQVETLQWRMADAVPNSKRGLTYMAAVSQLGQSFVRASQGFTELGKVVASIAIKES
ncbi:hypothetical protein DFO66_104239 [Brevibacterium sanguinis]|uniref:Phosphate transport regulator n=2 Tax=Brevibacterium TaxID=1696 RepID=A0A366IL25_9MICO|nr:MULTISPECIES: DUF47 domain-containing protein [Brevibacterium]RBP65654.1 hypothetical protein DFO66_104239 [Brevibacterium sanguinis]RBP72288.1 hypothetical protein DFO65_104245 [Brevibacterium celere]